MAHDGQHGERRLPELDVARGAAILCVLCIHSRLFFPGVLYTHVIDRAVPVLLVLFGLSSSLWWGERDAARTAAQWYRLRLTRLLPTYWAAVLLWWVGAGLLEKRWQPPSALLLSLAGYAPWIHTSWFVTAILQLVLLYPLLRRLVVRSSLAWGVALGATCMVVCQTYAFELTEMLRQLLPYPEAAPGFYAFWIFVPPYLWLVYCGMALAGGVGTTPPPVRVLVAAVAVFVCVGLIEGLTPRPSLAIRIAMSVGDVARTVLLLACARWLTSLERLRAVLAWCGRNSWEIYLGQMIAHSLGYAIWTGMGGPAAHRVIYTLFLAVAGIGFAVTARAVEGRTSGAR